MTVAASETINLMQRYRTRQTQNTLQKGTMKSHLLVTEIDSSVRLKIISYNEINVRRVIVRNDASKVTQGGMQDL